MIAILAAFVGAFVTVSILKKRKDQSAKSEVRVRPSNVAPPWGQSSAPPSTPDFTPDPDAPWRPTGE